ncbi:putative Transcriptional factor TINY [Hibiscus syriacus]|uniref:Transcriptional factor TINY n=1 Tax=Hibiscus syriacus TaxID=106335 RepID=A0A6A3BIU6_HIBSY|nr:putative Transcriptional factor TINY [Hibiscus syriacus]
MRMMKCCSLLHIYKNETTRSRGREREKWKRAVRKRKGEGKNAEKGLNRMSQIRSARPQSREHHPTPSSSDVKKESFDARDRKVFFSDDDDQSPETNQSHDISAAPVGLSEASTSSTLKQGTVDSNVSSKPLYIILLTDFTTALSRLFLDRKGVSGEAEEEKPAASQDDKENWDVTVILLERGLVTYRTIRALFTDFSIYAVVVICGTSLL